MFVRTNILIRRFGKCSMNVKAMLLKACLGVYDIALWKVFTQESINKFQACYNRCSKMFFGFSRRYSQLLIDTGLPSFSTVLHNSRCIFNKSWFACDNAVVAHLRELSVVLP